MKIQCAAVLLLLGLSWPGMLRSQTDPAHHGTPPTSSTTSQEPKPNPEGVYEVGNGILVPKLLSSTEPEYSEEARKKKIASDCLVALIVDSEGHPKSIHVVRSAAEGQPGRKQDAARTLDQKAIDAVSTYIFSPALLNGRPVPVSIHVDVQFWFMQTADGLPGSAPSPLSAIPARHAHISYLHSHHYTPSAMLGRQLFPTSAEPTT